MVQIPRLREWREARALTQVELAERAGVSSRSVAGYEAGTGARPPTVRKLAEALEVSIADLVGSTPPKAEAPEQPETFVDRLLRAPSMPIDELSDEELEDIRGQLAGGKPQARFVEDDPEWLTELAVHLIDETLRLRGEKVGRESV